MNNDVAILVCFALNGYHQLVSYKWFHDKRELIGNGYPVLYTRKSGEYECVVNGAGADMSQNFSVVVGMCSILFLGGSNLAQFLFFSKWRLMVTN